MANATVRDDHAPPCFFRNVAATTAAILHLDTSNGGVAPPGVNHLPAGIMVQGTGGTLQPVVILDASGTAVTIELLPGIFYRIAPKEIDATNAEAITVFWHPEP